MLGKGMGEMVTAFPFLSFHDPFILLPFIPLLLHSFASPFLCQLRRMPWTTAASSGYDEWQSLGASASTPPRLREGCSKNLSGQLGLNQHDYGQAKPDRTEKASFPAMTRAA